MHLITHIPCDLMHIALDDFVTLEVFCIVFYRTSVVFYLTNVLYRSNTAHNLCISNFSYLQVEIPDHSMSLL